MLYIAILRCWGYVYRNNVESHLLFALVLDHIIVGHAHIRPLLFVVDKFFRRSVFQISSCLHFGKYYQTLFVGYNPCLSKCSRASASPMLPVILCSAIALQNNISLGQNKII